MKYLVGIAGLVHATKDLCDGIVFTGLTVDPSDGRQAAAGGVGNNLGPAIEIGFGRDLATFDLRCPEGILGPSHRDARHRVENLGQLKVGENGTAVIVRNQDAFGASSRKTTLAACRADSPRAVSTARRATRAGSMGDSLSSNARAKGITPGWSPTGRLRVTSRVWQSSQRSTTHHRSFFGSGYVPKFSATLGCRPMHSQTVGWRTKASRRESHSRREGSSKS